MMFYSKCGPSAAKADVACAMRRLSGKCARVTHHSVAPILPMKSKGRFHPSNARRGSIGLSDALSAMGLSGRFQWVAPKIQPVDRNLQRA
jgi:hypothetical protein